MAVLLSLSVPFAGRETISTLVSASPFESEKLSVKSVAVKETVLSSFPDFEISETTGVHCVTTTVNVVLLPEHPLPFLTVM